MSIVSLWSTRKKCEYFAVLPKRWLKYRRDRGHLVTALHHENIERAENQARALFESITEVYLSCRDESPWLFGGNIGPTILDAHIVPFIARVGEGGRAKLIPNDLRQYARRIVALPQWLEVTHGRRTMWDVSYGHVRLIKDI